MNDWLSIAFGLTLLILAAEILVRGSVWCALALGVTPMMVGLTLVAFGTSAPELFVGISAATSDRPGFATGSVLGSNIANIGLIVGSAALLAPITHTPLSARFEVRYLLGVSLAIAAVAAASWTIGPPLAVGLLVALGAFTALLIRRESRARSRRREAGEEPADVARGPLATVLHVAMILGGLAGLKFGGDTLVDGAAGLARDFGMSEVVIGATVIAIGTSLPELAASVVAARRGHPELALGNVLGSNIFNVCMVLGVTALVRPLPTALADEGVASFVGLGLAAALAFLLRFRHGISRTAGAAMLLVYLGYVALAVLRGQF